MGIEEGGVKRKKYGEVLVLVTFCFVFFMFE
jgi:hypothetical protein